MTEKVLFFACLQCLPFAAHATYMIVTFKFLTSRIHTDTIFFSTGFQSSCTSAAAPQQCHHNYVLPKYSEPVMTTTHQHANVLSLCSLMWQDTHNACTTRTSPKLRQASHGFQRPLGKDKRLKKANSKCTPYTFGSCMPCADEDGKDCLKHAKT
jgi:hypothetical protein